MKDNKNKTTCPSCGKTGDYIEKPNYCAYCGINFQGSDNQNE